MGSAGAAQGAWRSSAAVRLVVMAVAMLLVAELAVAALAPAEKGIAPEPPVAAHAFPSAQLERGRSFRDGQRLLGYGGLALQLLAVGALAIGRPRRVRNLLDRMASRPALGIAAAAAVVVLLAALVTLPTGIAGHERAVDAGVSSQSLRSWFSDFGLSLAIEVPLVAIGLILLAWVVRRLPRGWPVPVAVGAVGIGAALTLLGPVLLAPRFNDFERLPANSALRRQVEALGDRAGVRIGSVYRVDASRRSRVLNAYVDGLGPSKRVVIYDTAIRAAGRAELRSLLAHELGHVAHDDVPRGIFFAFWIAPLGAVFARELALLLARRGGFELGTVSSVPALILSLAVTAFILGTPGNQLSREVEASADAFALRVTHDPKAFVKLQRRLVRTNVADPDPPAVPQFLFGTHPSAVERIGSARAYADMRP